jgi:hypothetical protein
MGSFVFVVLLAPLFSPCSEPHSGRGAEAMSGAPGDLHIRKSERWGRVQTTLVEKPGGKPHMAALSSQLLKRKQLMKVR